VRAQLLLLATVGLTALGSGRGNGCGSGRASNVQRVTLVGDSITVQYRPAFVSLLRRVYGAVVRGHSEGGTNPAQSDWAAWVDAAGAADVVVIQDFAFLGGDVQGVELNQYLAAYQKVIDRAREHGASVYVVEAPSPVTHDNVRGITGWITPPPPDSADGVHYEAAGQKLLAHAVCEAIGSRSCAVD
jgi:lysophospholipase L1-like esterase